MFHTFVRSTLAVFAIVIGGSAGYAQTPAQAPGSPRTRVGVALGGGSARGLAHVGVLKWLEAHRIPVDVLSGTSMGGLIGGSYATGLTPPEIEAMLAEIDWDAMFGRSGFDSRMSLPLIFPAIKDADRVLVDGGAMNNVPADVARQMGADTVIAVNVGDLTDRETISASLFGLAGATLDAMMRANTLQALKAANVVINVPVTDYGSLDWRRFRDLIREGYGAAEAMNDQLLPLAVSEAEWQQWSARRAAARRTAMPTIGFVEVNGAASSDTDFIRRAMAKHEGQPLDAVALATTLTELGGLDRYESLRWSVHERNGMNGLGG